MCEGATGYFFSLAFEPTFRTPFKDRQSFKGDAGADQGLVADDPEREAHQNRREGRPPWPLRRIPDGRGRHPAKSVCRHPAADRGTAAAAGSRIDVKRLLVLRPIKNQRGEVRLDDNKIHIFGARRANVTGLGARKPRAEEPALPMSAESGDLGLNIK